MERLGNNLILEIYFYLCMNKSITRLFKSLSRNAEKLKEEEGQGCRFYGVLFLLYLVGIH
jgi:hypothetical protein